MSAARSPRQPSRVILTGTLSVWDPTRKADMLRRVAVALAPPRPRAVQLDLFAGRLYRSHHHRNQMGRRCRPASRAAPVSS